MKSNHSLDSLYTDLFLHHPENMFVTDAQGTIFLVNHQCSEQLQYADHELLGKSIRHFLSLPDNAPADFEAFWTAVRLVPIWQGELFIKGKNNLHLLKVSVKRIRTRHCESAIVYLFMARVEVSAQGSDDTPIATEVFDRLTGLPNRFLFKKKLEHAMEQAKRFQFNIGFLYIDLDNFKSINTLKNQPEPEKSYRFFQQAMNSDSSVRLRLESDLRQALDRKEFEVFYQPI